MLLSDQLLSFLDNKYATYWMVGCNDQEFEASLDHMRMFLNTKTIVTATTKIVSQADCPCVLMSSALSSTGHAYKP